MIVTVTHDMFKIMNNLFTVVDMLISKFACPPVSIFCALL